MTWDKFIWMFVALAMLAVIVSARAPAGTGRTTSSKVTSATASAISSIGQAIVDLVHVIVGAPSTSAPSLGG